MRLGFGEYVDPQGFIPHVLARQHFLDALEVVEPRVLDDLMGRPLELALEAIPPQWLTMAVGESLPIDLTDRVGVAIHAWMRRWRLGDDEVTWVGAAALWTLMGWVTSIEGNQSLDELERRLRDPPLLDAAFQRAYRPWERFRPHFTLTAGEGAAPLVLEAEWDPYTETRAAAEERITAEVAWQVRREFDAIEAGRRAAGQHLAPIKRTGREHFRWLARYQVRGESYAAIARAVCRERQTVKEAIQETALLIGLPLRPPDRAGRPRAAKPGRPRIVRVDRTRR